ncbi:Utp14-domain-containing protein [Calocera cornea HHB12733]|uniref:Utp14-domain-containing protein n=1 Tax=Calocera cornea HHB12733 TaxID=1353952 RepID=A0A165EKI1_9BASI|nr:Utp14-domain-containing protein [Calocera cornea HHB12733]
MAKGGRSTGRAPGHRQNGAFAAADRKKYNAAGAAKRIASRGNKGSALDVYEYSQAKNRRAGVRQDLDKDEEELGRGGAEDLDDVRLPPQFKMPGDDEDGVVDSGEDEEIDSDEAFEGESDEERFAHFEFESNKKKASAAKKGQAEGQAAPKASKKASSAPLINLDEDDVVTFGGFDDDINVDAAEEKDEEGDEAMEDEEGADFIDLSKMLDEGSDEDEDEDDDDDEEDEEDAEDEGDEDEGAEEPALRSAAMESMRQEEDEEEEEDSDEDVDEEEAAEDADEEEEDGALAKLSTFIDTLSRKRKLDDSEAASEPAERKVKRRVLPEATAAGPENEFAVPGGKRKLQLQDLLAPLSQDATAADLLSLQKSTKALTSSKSAPLTAPLPLRAQEKLDRQAAYEATKAEVQKWAPAMRRIREAEHLSFPLQAEPVARETNASLASSFKPTTELESAVDRLLKAAELREEDVLKTEEFELAHLSKEEVAARRAELRQMRELMFRAEAKAKRVSKIKSKTYHRIQKRRNEKERRALEEAGLLPDEQGIGEEGSERRKELERDRALERATQRHKNTGKWAKAMLSKGEMDVDVRREMNEQLERSERLRKKILGQVEDDEESESEDDEDADEETIRDRAFNELAALDATEAAPEGNKSKGLMNMKFMQDAATEDEQRVNKDRDDFIRELQRIGADPDKMQEDSDGGEEKQAFVLVGGNQGRRVFGPGTGIQQSATEAPPQAVVDSSDFMALSPSDDDATAPTATAESGSNPWLSAGGPAKRTSKKNHALTKDSSAADKSQAVLKGQLGKTQERQKEREDEARVEISMEDVLKVDRPKNGAKNPSGQKTLKEKKAEKAQGKSQVATVDEAYHDEDSEDDSNMKNASAFTQRDLVAQAFAGDNVLEEFEEEKRREMEADAPREEDITLPGWGSWGGKGTREPKKKFTKSVPGVLPTERADAGKKNVIINEKRDKKGGKYQVKDLPWPYTSKGQFERMVEQPLGSEWNTRTVHQRLTVPRVVTKMGTVIDPLEKLF